MGGRLRRWPPFANMRFMWMLNVAGVAGFLAVALGAFGAHGLRERLPPGSLEIYRTGALYHLVHAAVLVAVALMGDRLRFAPLATVLFALGIVLFSGSLYLLAASRR
jgi:uncharacterized membrane protein YgdD (TMEM256/DUF423 family)